MRSIQSATKKKSKQRSIHLIEKLSDMFIFGLKVFETGFVWHCTQCRSSLTLSPAKILTGAPIVISKKRFRRYGTSRGRMAFTKRILIFHFFLKSLLF